MFVENGVQAADFVLGARFGVGQVFGCIAQIVVCLALNGTEAGVLEEEPVLLMPYEKDKISFHRVGKSKDFSVRSFQPPLGSPSDS